MSSDVAAALSGKSVDREETNDRFLAIVLDDPELLEAEFAALVDGLEPGSGAGADGQPAHHPAGRPVPCSETDEPCPAGVESAGDGTASARPPPSTR